MYYRLFQTIFRFPLEFEIAGPKLYVKNMVWSEVWLFAGAILLCSTVLIITVKYFQTDIAHPEQVNLANIKLTH